VLRRNASEGKKGNLGQVGLPNLEQDGFPLLFYTPTIPKSAEHKGIEQISATKNRENHTILKRVTSDVDLQWSLVSLSDERTEHNLRAGDASKPAFCYSAFPAFSPVRMYMTKLTSCCGLALYDRRLARTTQSGSTVTLSGSRLNMLRDTCVAPRSAAQQSDIRQHVSILHCFKAKGGCSFEALSVALTPSLKQIEMPPAGGTAGPFARKEL
jgi:hypothetical protein